MKKILFTLFFITCFANIKSETLMPYLQNNQNQQSILENNQDLLQLKAEYEKLSEERKKFYTLSNNQFKKEIKNKNFLYTETDNDILEKYKKSALDFSDAEFFAMTHYENNEEIESLKQKMVLQLIDKNSYKSLKKCLKEKIINKLPKNFDPYKIESCGKYIDAQYSTSESFIKPFITKNHKWDYTFGNPINLSIFFIATVLANDPINFTK